MRSVMPAWPLLWLFCRSPVAYAVNLNVSLPVVDLAADNNVSQRLLDATMEHGFVILVGHGLEGFAQNCSNFLERALANATDASTAGWRRPHEGYGPGLQHKDQMQAEEGGRVKTIDGVYTISGREDFVFINPDATSGKAAHDPIFDRPEGEIWFGDVEQRCPDKATCEAFAAYFAQAMSLSEQLLRMYGKALTGKSEAFMFGIQPKHVTLLVGAYHSGGSIMDDDSKRTRVSGHSDNNLLSIIHYGSTGPNGLEVRDRASGEWLRVQNNFPHDALQLNIGESLQRLSNGWLRATPHRVIDRTPAGQEMTDRTAIIFFPATSFDAIITPQVQVPEGEDNATQYEPKVAGHLTHCYKAAPLEQRQAFDVWAKSRLLGTVQQRMQTEL